MLIDRNSRAAKNRVDVTSKLKTGPNQLVILFTSAFLLGKEIEQGFLGKDKHLTLWNGDASRLFVRKAGYNCQRLLYCTRESALTFNAEQTAGIGDRF